MQYTWVFSLLLYTLTCAFTALPICAQTHKIVAIVNAEAITDLDVKRRIQLIQSLSGKEQLEKDIFDNILTLLIDEKLISQESLKQKLTAEKQDMDNAWSILAKQNKMTIAQLKENMKAANINLQEFELQLRSQVLQAKLLRIVIEPSISANDFEAAEVGAITNSQSIQDPKIHIKEQKMMIKLRDYLNKLRSHSYIEIRKF